MGDCSCLCVCFHQIGCIGFLTFIVCIVRVYLFIKHESKKPRCILVLLSFTARKPLQNHPPDFWTWEEILDGKGPWAQPGEYRRPKEELEAAKVERHWYEEAARRRGWKPESQPQPFLGGGTQGVWRRQVGDLRQLPVLTGGRERPGRHRVMLWSARCPQCGCIARCGTYRFLVSAGLEWASSQVP